ncbi:MAG: hypothetical protein IPL31_05925 [Saprospiraceae bacterium]|nr:hypothetical protein [Saprospiraceae bacterium]
MRVKLKEARNSKSLSFTGLVAALKQHSIDITPPSLYKIETGETKKIKQNLLDALSDILGIPTTDVEEVDNRVVQRQIQIGCPYVTWAAPIILAVHKIVDEDPEFKATAYGIFSSEPEDNSIHWLSDPIDFELKKFRASLSTEGKSVYTYNAKHLFRFIDQDNLDIICVADGVVDLRHDKDDFIPVAHILKSPNEGCDLAVFSKSNLDSIITFNDLLNYFKKIYDENIKQVIKAIEDKTDIRFNDAYKNKITNAILSLLERNNISLNDKEFLLKCKKEGSLNYLQWFRSNYKTKEQKGFITSLIESVFELLILYAEKTVAEIHFNKFLRDPKLNFIRPQHICLANASGWNATLTNLMYPFLDNDSNFITNYEFELSYLGWQPKIRHIQEELNHITKNNSRIWNIRLFNLPKITNHNEPIFLTGQLLINKKNNSLLFSDLVYRFANRLKDTSDRLNFIIKDIRLLENKYLQVEEFVQGLKNENLKSMESDFMNNFFITQEDKLKDAEKKFIHAIDTNSELQILSDFFELTKLECYLAIKNLVFSHSFDTKWINQYIDNLQNVKSRVQ